MARNHGLRGTCTNLTLLCGWVNVVILFHGELPRSLFRRVLSYFGDILSYHCEMQWVTQSIITQILLAHTHMHPHMHSHAHRLTWMKSHSCGAVRLIGTLNMPLQLCFWHFVLFTCTVLSLTSISLCPSWLFSLPLFPSFHTPCLIFHVSSYSLTTSRIILTAFCRYYVQWHLREEQYPSAQGDEKQNTSKRNHLQKQIISPHGWN